MKYNKDISIERRKTELLGEITKISIQNFCYRAINLRNIESIEKKVKPILKELAYLYKLQEGA